MPEHMLRNMMQYVMLRPNLDWIEKNLRITIN